MLPGLPFHTTETFTVSGVSTGVYSVRIAILNPRFGDQPGVVADYPGVPSRKPKEHTWAGIDTAIIDWPEKTAQLELIARDLRGERDPDPLRAGPHRGA